MHDLVDSDISMEDMLSIICKHNGLDSLEFVIYRPLDDYARGLIEIMEKEKAKEYLEASIVWREKLDPKSFGEGTIRDINKKNNPDQLMRYLGISSQVAPGYRLKHIDFDCELTKDDVEKMGEEIGELDLGPGWIVPSGHSFHYHGRDVIDNESWRSFMEKMDRKSQGDSMLDKNYAFLSMARDYSVLRVCGYGYLPDPFVIAEIK